MAPRLKLQALLKDLLGSSNVYYQPPAKLIMSYPCFVYARDLANVQFADNFPYRHTKRYSLTYITRDPDDPIIDKVDVLPLCTMSRVFTTDNLHHHAYNLYF